MSLANEEDIIIPGTTGLITAIGREANNEESLVDYIRKIPAINRIISGRQKGIPLEQLVNPQRISSNSTRTQIKPNMEKQERKYEDWFNDRR